MSLALRLAARGLIDDLDATGLGGEHVGLVLRLALAIADGVKIARRYRVVVGEKAPARFGAPLRQPGVVSIGAGGVGVAADRECSAREAGVGEGGAELAQLRHRFG